MLIKARLNLLKKTKDGSKKLLKKIYNFIPCIFTFLNAIFGFISILKSFDNNYRMATICIAIAGLMDLADGKIARALGLCSYFGMELDSLSDAISFCLAPTLLIYCWSSYTDLSYWHISILFFYMCAGIARLAKFNIDAANNMNNKIKNKSNFIGLPTTASALFIVSIVLAFDNIIYNNALYTDIIFCLIAMTSALMISNLKFKSIKNINIFSLSTISFAMLNILAVYSLGFRFIFAEFVIYIVFNIINNIKLNYKRI